MEGEPGTAYAAAPELAVYSARADLFSFAGHSGGKKWASMQAMAITFSGQLLTKSSGIGVSDRPRLARRPTRGCNFDRRTLREKHGCLVGTGRRRVHRDCRWLFH